MILGFIFATFATVQAASYKDCGEPNGIPFATSYVRGGSTAKAQSWPWVASIRSKEDGGHTNVGKHICAGTLITDRLILTAAHCMLRRNGIRRKKGEIFVAVGSHHSNRRLAHEEWIAVTSIHIHPYYRSKRVRAWAYDLAIIELHNPSSYRDAARPACLPTKQAEGKCLVVGWGRTESHRESYVLKQAFIPIVNRTECNARKYWNKYIDETMICAGKIDPKGEHSVSACQGDSGGPLVCEEDNGAWAVNGIVSWGPVLCGDKPSVYTNVANKNITQWITNIIDGRDSTTPKPKPSTPSSYTRTRPTIKNTTYPSLPCDAALFERIPQLIIYGPSPDDDHTLTGVSAKTCVENCCERGIEECSSFIYFPSAKECKLRKNRRCDEEGKQFTRYVHTDVIYYGVRCNR